ncbi:MAG TPA: DUF2269 family protein [Dehalococcoidia bacterium]|nr:DUF2269 family protein [Dehalococcoidia bacterium]
MDLHDQILTFKFLHVLAVLVFFAGQGLEIPNLAFAARSRHPHELRAHLSMVRFAENALILPSAIAIPVFGWLTAWRADISLGETWLSIAQTLYFVALAIALVYLRPFYLRMARRADTLPADGGVPDDLRSDLRKPAPIVVGNLLGLVLIGILYLMVFQPGS